MLGNGLPSGWSPVDLGTAGNGPYRVLRAAQAGLVQRFVAACEDPAAAQAAALRRTLDAARGTAVARRYGLDRVRTLDEYRRAVPVQPWSAWRDDLAAAAAGRGDQVVRHPIQSFVRTSGTTDAPKVLPVTAPWAREVSDAQRLWVLAMLAFDERLAGGRALVQSGRAREATAEGGGDVGANTGRMAAAQPWWVRARYATPGWVSSLPDPSLRRYLTWRLALPLDVRSWTTANPTTVLAMARALEDFREDLAADLRDGTVVRGPARALSRRQRLALWPHLRRMRLPDGARAAQVWDLSVLACWKGGGASAFLPRLGPALGAEVPVWDPGISASEGFFAVALHPSWGGGVAWLDGHLMEFVDDRGEALSAWEIEVGREYRLVISTTAGLYRYDLDDRVRVVGWWRAAPVLEFVGKGTDVLSATGEKVTAEQVAQAVRAAGGADGFSCGLGGGEIPFLVLLAEGGGLDAGRFDDELGRRNIEYQAKRADGRMAAPVVAPVADGFFAAWRDDRARAGGLDGQVKDPVVLPGPAFDAMLDRAGYGRLKVASSP